MKFLLIAEKPSMMRDIQKVYKNMRGYEHTIDFSSFAGHVVESYYPSDYDERYDKWRGEDLPIIPTQFKYKASQRTKDLYDNIVNKIKTGNYDAIINATDAGREGELIYWAFDDTIEHNLPVYRYWSSDSTEASVEKALKNLIPPNNEDIKNLEHSARLRAIFDWLVGMNFSRASSIATSSNLSVGRVQTPTLRLIVDRELEIRNFKPEPFFELVGSFNNSVDEYVGSWFDKETNNRRFTKKEDVERLVEKINGIGVGQIINVTKKETRKNPPTLHSLLELQKEAGKVLGLSSKETLDIAQSLYETHKMLTYPRTDSRHIPQSMASEIKEHLQSVVTVDKFGEYAKDILNNDETITKTMKSKRFVDNRKVTDHHALIPTKGKHTLNHLSEKEKGVYLLVVRRFLAIFMNPEISDVTTVITQIGDEHFRSKGTILKDKGYTVLYEDISKSKSKDKILPPVQEGEDVKINDLVIVEKETTPPKRFDDADLLTAMSNVGNQIEEEELKNILKDVAGLGTSATRSGIIESLINKQWIERKKKIFYPTERGIQVIQTLGEREITSPVLTARWEGELTKVEEGELKYEEFNSQMNQFIAETTNDLLTNLQEANAKVVCDCPKCDGQIIERDKVFVCTNKNSGKCDFLFAKTFCKAKITSDDIVDLSTKKKMEAKNFTFKSGKKGKAHVVLQQDGSLKFEFVNESKTIGKCPVCSGNVIVLPRSYGCETNLQSKGNDCNFMIAKNILGASITQSDVKNLLSGKETAIKKFNFKNGEGEARLKWNNGKLNFIFNNRK